MNVQSHDILYPAYRRHKIGNVYHTRAANGNEQMNLLTCCDFNLDGEAYVVLVDLLTCMPWCPPVRVADVNNITDSEMLEIVDAFDIGVVFVNFGPIHGLDVEYTEHVVVHDTF